MENPHKDVIHILLWLISIKIHHLNTLWNLFWEQIRFEQTNTESQMVYQNTEFTVIIILNNTHSR